MYNDHIWVGNEFYNETRAADLAADQRRSSADEEVRLAKDLLRRAGKESARLTGKESFFLGWRLRRETKRLLRGIDHVSEEMDRALEQYASRTQAQMDGLHRSLSDVQTQADALDEKIGDLAADVAGQFQALADAVAEEHARARLYANQFEELLEQIRALHPEKLTPGVVEESLAPVSDFLAADIAAGDYQAAIAVAQTKLPEAVALQLRLERMNIEFLARRDQIHDLIEEAGAQISLLEDAGRNCRDVEIGGIVYEYDGELAYWTDGLFRQVREGFERLCAGAAVEEVEMDLEGMARSAALLGQVGAQLRACEEFARQEFELFGMIQNLATGIFNALTRDEAWYLLDSGFVHDDARRSFQMSYGDGQGNTASFVVIPNREMNRRGQAGEIQFLVDVSDGAQTADRERCLILREGILARLAGSGIDIGEHNRKRRTAVSSGKDAFLRDAAVQGNRIKENRVAAVRAQLFSAN